MSGAAGIPWERYALIAELAHRLKDGPSHFGKTKLQKLVFLAQELYDVKSLYRFSLHTYGPFAAKLRRELDIVDVLGGVVVQTVGTGLGGYNIAPGRLNGELRERGKGFLQDPVVSESLDRLVSEFGEYNARELELRATIIFVYRRAGIPKSEAGRHKLIRLVKDIKPRFSEHEIEEAVGELQEGEHISFG